MEKKPSSPRFLAVKKLSTRCFTPPPTSLFHPSPPSTSTFCFMLSGRLASENQEKSKRRGMRREGKQHGLVRSVITTPTRNRVVNRFDCLPTAGIFHKVSPKPTNHSKFTGTLCFDGCRALPATKSRGKAKGNHKLKANDVSMNQKFIAWRVMDKQKQSNYIGLSATEILDGLIRDDPNEYDGYHFEEEEEVAEFSDQIALNCDENEVPNVADAVAGESDELQFGGFDVYDHGDDDDDYDLVFYNVEIDYESEGEEGWCLVEDEIC